MLSTSIPPHSWVLLSPLKVEHLKLEAIGPKPKTLKQLQCFLGLANFYRRLIRDFSSVAGSLIALTKPSKTHFHLERSFIICACSSPLLPSSILIQINHSFWRWTPAMWVLEPLSPNMVRTRRCILVVYSPENVIPLNSGTG